MLSQYKSSLLTYAISRLSPEVFTHPIWLHFGKKEVSGSLNIVDDLLSVAKRLKEHDPSSACQVLLICAVYQNYAGQHISALRATQQALALAERTGLLRETIWAIWGACAISVQQGNYEQAANNLVDLKATLSEQNEWILADYVEVVKQCLFHPPKIDTANNSGSPRNEAYGDLLTLTFNWLHQWGYISYVSRSEFSEFGVASDQQKMTRPLFLNKLWKNHWHSLSLKFHGELKLQWSENDSHSNKKRLSFWRFNLVTLLRSLFGRNIHTNPKEDVDNDYQSSTLILTPTEEIHPPDVLSSQDRPALATKNKNQIAGQAPTLISVAVYMLGTFNMIIGDTTMKLPASRGLSVLKYLLLHHNKNIPREVLMDVFWPDAKPETSRNNLNVAMHNLRRSLRTVTHMSVIVYEAGAYGLDPNLQVWLDVEELERSVKAGQRLEAWNQLAAAVAEYEAAISLYQGDFLEQSPYDEWTVFERERLWIAYMDALDRLSQIYFSQERYAACITVCQLILTRDRCREEAHCLLMRCYSHQGQYHLALRQYQICVEALHAELEVEPTPETTKLYDQIRRRERILFD